jgi:hypothetical protein
MSNRPEWLAIGIFNVMGAKIGKSQRLILRVD